MYSLEITCQNCNDKVTYERQDLWRIILLSNELELMVLENKAACKPCQQLAPFKMVLRNLSLSVIVFEKIISNIGNTTHTKPKPSMDNPCAVCKIKGKIEVQYKAHRTNAGFVGILTEECPICDGRGYTK